MVACRCQFCAAGLEPVQAFRYLVESATSDPAELRRIRALPHAGGRPLRVCKGCQADLCADPAGFLRAAARRPAGPGLLAAALLSLGWCVLALLGDG